jgi:ornithine--oxo-acid transaminase
MYSNRCRGRDTKWCSFWNPLKKLGFLNPGQHGSTFGGNPLACAIARTALKVLVEEGLIENAAAMGTYFLEGLKQISNPYIREVRGQGLMIGLEFYPEAGGAGQYCEKLKNNGLLCKETHDHIIRFTPLLIITKDQIDWALEIISKCIRDLEHAHRKVIDTSAMRF